MEATGHIAEIQRFAVGHAAGVSALAQAEGWPTFSDQARVVRLLAAPGTVGEVAVDGEGKVVGAAHLLTDGHHAYLTFLAVAAHARRGGIGRRLIDAAFADSGAERIDLLATEESADFYRRLRHFEFVGFRVYPKAADQPT
ncbi:MAG TPA: GNAT family N-acetyltransferase [Actinopolymorphaceae bacterium]|nr:GNAT family N-acetyltransferase [Actinopolymorphaceae bacterium]